MSELSDIAKENDRFRSAMTLNKNNKIVFTEGVKSHRAVHELIGEVRRYKNFTKENDVYGEHDFGAIKIGDDQFYWKIDYSSEPKDEDCVRTLTIMLASEYRDGTTHT